MYTVRYPAVFKGASGNLVSFFLAGNITSWRGPFIDHMTSENFFNTIVIDPTFIDYDPQKNTKWEFNVMKKVDCVVFWFGNETLAPITLLTLGCICRDHLKDMIIAIDPQYPKREDIVAQLKLFRPDLTIYSTLTELMAEMGRYMEICNGLYDTSKLQCSSKTGGNT